MSTDTALLVVQILKELVGLVMDIAATGKDPVTEIQRIRKSADWLGEAKQNLDASVARKFGG